MSDFSHETGPHPKKEVSTWKKYFSIKKLLLLLLIIAVLISLTWLLVFLAIAISNDSNTLETFSNSSDAPSNLRTDKQYTHDSLYNEDTANDFIVDSCNQICNSSICFEKANFYLKNMNTEIDPCDDFYQFACGNFIKNTPIPDDENKIDPIRIIQKKIYNELIHEMEKEINPDEPEAFKKTKKFYQNCMNEPLVQERGTKILLDLLSDVGGWPVLQGESWNDRDYSWIETVLKLYEYGYSPVLPGLIEITRDPKNSTRKFLSVSSAVTKISRYFLTDGPNNKVLKAYHRYMIDIAVMLGASKYNALNEMTECVKFEIDLFHTKSSIEDSSNTSRTQNPYTIKELSVKHPTVPWLDFFKRILSLSNVNIDEYETINLSDPSYMVKFENLLARTPKRVIANYVLWQVICNSIDYLPDEFLERQLSFNMVKNGVKERKPRAHKCLDEVMVVCETSVGAIYARNHFNTGFRVNARDLVQNIKHEFRKTLLEADWMDEETRVAAEDKLDAMSVFVAYSDELLDDGKIDEYYENLEIEGDDYLSSSFNVSRFYLQRYFEGLRKPTDDWTSQGNSAVVNAFYNRRRNLIVLPAGVLQREFFDSSGPNYLNYGAIGSVVGHEITHGFDSEGRKADKDGNQVDWWRDRTKDEYLRRSECFVEQYDDYTVEGLKVNGKLTLSENIADNGGFKVAYHAYVEWTRNNGRSEECLPLVSYTPRQMFWISAANVWCSKRKPEALKASLLGDFHSPPAARVTLSFSNLNEFSNDFKCELGARMNPVNKCAVW